jgi:hypothetical protein
MPLTGRSMHCNCRDETRIQCQPISIRNPQFGQTKRNAHNERGPKPILSPLLDDTQAAQLLGNMHPRTLQRLARTHMVPAIKIGRFWFFRASALNEWIGVQSEHRPCFSKETK